MIPKPTIDTAKLESYKPLLDEFCAALLVDDRYAARIARYAMVIRERRERRSQSIPE